MGSQVTEVKGAAQKQGDKKQEVFQSAAFYDNQSRLRWDVLNELVCCITLTSVNHFFMFFDLKLCRSCATSPQFRFWRQNSSLLSQSGLKMLLLMKPLYRAPTLTSSLVKSTSWFTNIPLVERLLYKVNLFPHIYPEDQHLLLCINHTLKNQIHIFIK